ncbi:tannase/feruloyl esterase family alpha/beta hydrolase [Sphingobium sufflavum]|uniref:tannase/feruloyl esterase family alpha/beta hydrolase n=1 Tax=Sphingobium sufflavum TaxID=1129547 RepID=UPI001F211D68|nr:tannase/feruloyl esterase family alpha/beta hydrolase [Sphingobium sufflavum]MCE7797071.1 tannase/feruloyl esterase family alpha/beta hydrolase [Sphingobium sufflavum]
MAFTPHLGVPYWPTNVSDVLGTSMAAYSDKGEGAVARRLFQRSWSGWNLTALLGSAVFSMALVDGYGSALAQPGPPATLAGQPVDACSALSRMRIEAVHIVSATHQMAGARLEGARLPNPNGSVGSGAPVAGLPAFCRVVGSIAPEFGSDIGFEVWLPADKWDGRFYGVGLGGFAGSIDYITLGLALKAGQASAATDTGHRGSPMDSAWAKGHPERVRDYGWRAVHLTTVAAKKLVAAYYARGPSHSYFVGCSGGGRQGLMEASRFPDDYDGILAGAPAANFTNLAMSMTNAIQAQLPAGAAIRTSQARLLQDEVVRQCDTIDGQADGLVADPRLCHFDTSKLACGTSKSDQCFSPVQLSALKRIYAGPRDASGHVVARGFLPSGSEVGSPTPQLGWEGYLLTPPGREPRNESLAGGLLGDLVQEPFATTASFDFSKHPAQLKGALAQDLDAQPDLGRFFKRGGKLILWHGWADAAIPPEATIDYFEALKRNGGAQAKKSSRLFMVSGVQHCMGGTGPASFGQLNAPQNGENAENSMVAALQSWVEGGPAPETLVARRGFGGVMGMPISKPEQQRRLCAYPAKEVLRAGADPDKATSYDCQPAQARPSRSQ